MTGVDCQKTIASQKCCSAMSRSSVQPASRHRGRSGCRRSRCRRPVIDLWGRRKRTWPPSGAVSECQHIPRCTVKSVPKRPPPVFGLSEQCLISRVRSIRLLERPRSRGTMFGQPDRLQRPKYAILEYGFKMSHWCSPFNVSSAVEHLIVKPRRHSSSFKASARHVGGRITSQDQIPVAP